MKVLFVCSGNICRSPMAAEYMRHRAAHWELSHVVVDSAGTLGIQGEPAAANAIEAMGELGVDLTLHRSKGIDEAQLRTSDFIVSMDHDHVLYLALHYSGVGGYRYLLRAFERGPEIDSDPLDLDDPVGGPLELFRQQRDQIVRCVDHLALYLKHAD